MRAFSCNMFLALRARSNMRTLASKYPWARARPPLAVDPKLGSPEPCVQSIREFPGGQVVCRVETSSAKLAESLFDIHQGARLDDH